MAERFKCRGGIRQKPRSQMTFLWHVPSIHFHRFNFKTSYLRKASLALDHSTKANLVRLPDTKCSLHTFAFKFLWTHTNICKFITIIMLSHVLLQWLENLNLSFPVCISREQPLVLVHGTLSRLPYQPHKDHGLRFHRMCHSLVP